MTGCAAEADACADGHQLSGAGTDRTADHAACGGTGDRSGRAPGATGGVRTRQGLAAGKEKGGDSDEKRATYEPVHGESSYTLNAKGGRHPLWWSTFKKSRLRDRRLASL
jgi:hypothetical protein